MVLLTPAGLDVLERGEVHDSIYHSLLTANLPSLYNLLTPTDHSPFCLYVDYCGAEMFTSPGPDPDWECGAERGQLQPTSTVQVPATGGKQKTESPHGSLQTLFPFSQQNLHWAESLSLQSLHCIMNDSLSRTVHLFCCLQSSKISGIAYKFKFQVTKLDRQSTGRRMMKDLIQSVTASRVNCKSREKEGSVTVIRSDIIPGSTL